MATLVKLMKSALFLSACTGVGVVLWMVAAPSEERKQELMKNFPEANAKQMAETRERNILVMQAIKEAAETNENVARRTPWSK
ncbi:ubiquinol-cytochrome-c reductase complex assembly factor 3 [Pleurodeles waltl]|uniref:ubiquinol-cytochrome-c reductase complex assembly factor 3 n=1 Tax=Pleurodeles waltl TaxID=8319 RepID=UPI0037096272